MPSNPAKPFLVPRRDDPQLQRLNEKHSETGCGQTCWRCVWRLCARGPSGRLWPSKPLLSLDRRLQKGLEFLLGRYYCSSRPCPLDEQ